MSQLKLFTFNLHGLAEPDPMACLTTLANFIVANDFDVIFLQEIVAQFHPTANDPLAHTGTYLTNTLSKLGCHGYTLHLSMAHEAWGTCHEYVGVLTRLPVLNSETVRISQTDDESDFNRRVVQVTTVKFQDSPLQCISGHFSWSDANDPFGPQFAVLDDFIKTSKLPTIIGGDFNIESFSPAYIDVINRGYTDLYLVKGSDSDWTIFEEIAGWHGKGSHGKRIDFIFANTPVIVTHALRHFTGSDKPMISDHASIAIDLQF